VIRLYRALLRLYPASFREAYGQEMCGVFAERVAAATGPFASVRLLAAALVDVVPNALSAHGELLAQDLRYAARTLARSPGFAVTAVLVVAFGVGANTAAFSLADFVLVRPLPFPEADRLVRVWERVPGYSMMELSPANYRDWKATTGSFESTGAFFRTAANMVGSGEPQRLGAALVTPDLLPTLGVEPARGRWFDAEGGPADDASVILSWGLWQQELGGDPDVVGSTLNLDGQPRQVVGVMPETFAFPSRATRVWVPLVLGEDAYQDRNDNFLNVVGRLADGVTVEQARADLERAAARLAATFPLTNAETGSNVYLMRDDLSPHSRILLAALGGAALCILLLACANLTNLLLARGAARSREMAVRAALGAGRHRLVRQMVTESAALALVGGALGVGLAALALPVLTLLVPSNLPVSGEPRLDLRVLGLAALFTGLTGVGFGVLPALRAGGKKGLDAIREAGRGGSGRRQGLRAALVSVQVASSVVLLVCSGLLARAMWRLQDVDPGFRSEGVLTLRTALPPSRYAPVAARGEFYSRVITEVEALPGVSRAAFTSGLPIVMGGGIWPVGIQGEEVVRQGSNTASLRFVTPGFFDALDISLVRGRGPEDGDTFDRPFVAVVSESFVERYWPGQDPIGRTFEFGFFERTVVGVAADIRVRGLERESEPQVWLPHGQVPDGGLIGYMPKDLVIRTDGDPEALVPAVRRIVGEVDPEQPVSDVRTMDAVVVGESATRRTQLRALGALTATALILAGIGLHGLLAFTVSMRTREIGVRMALGAHPRSVARMVLGEGMLLTALGIVPGVVVAVLAGRAMASLLLGVRPGDPVTLAVAVCLVLATAVLGSLLPALRALRVSPMRAIAEQ
jgi:predicted permease